MKDWAFGVSDSQAGAFQVGHNLVVLGLEDLSQRTADQKKVGLGLSLGQQDTIKCQTLTYCPEGGEASRWNLIFDSKREKINECRGKQCDVWALIKTMPGTVSLAVEAKAAEPFGSGNETLGAWMKSGNSLGSEANRKNRWEHIRENLPEANAAVYNEVPFQILQRSAAAVIEARRFGLKHAAFVVQSFGSPPKSFDLFAKFCASVGISAGHNRMNFAQVSEVRLGIGWADCALASDSEMASVL